MEGSAEQSANEEVGEWLNKQGLSKYTSLLNLNGYKQFTDCFALTSEALKQLGITDIRDVQKLLILRRQKRLPLPQASTDQNDDAAPAVLRGNPCLKAQQATAEDQSVPDSVSVQPASESVPGADKRCAWLNTGAEKNTMLSGKPRCVTPPHLSSSSSAATLDDSMQAPQLPVRSGSERMATRPLANRSVIDQPLIAWDAASLSEPGGANVAALEVGPLMTMKQKADSTSNSTLNVAATNGTPKERKNETLITVAEPRIYSAPKYNVHVKVSDRTPRDEFSLEYRERCLLPVNLQIRTLGLGLGSNDSPAPIPPPSRKRGTVRVIRVSDGAPPDVESDCPVATKPRPSAPDARSPRPPNSSPRITAGSDGDSDDEVDAARRRPPKALIVTTFTYNEAATGGRSATKVLSGFLTLLPGTVAGSGTFWAVFDGNDLRLFKNEKARITKRVVPLQVVEKLGLLANDRTRFALFIRDTQVVFDASKGEEARRWTETIDAAVKSRPKVTGELPRVEKEGWLVLDRDKKRSFLTSNTRARKYLAIFPGLLRVYGSIEERQSGCPIFEVHMELATIKLVSSAAHKLDHFRLQLIDVQANESYTLSFESVTECEEWNKALQHAILVALDKVGSGSDSGNSKTLSKIYENPSNRACADCGASDPEWASINLAIMICDRCAGCHRQLSVTYSKVQSVRLDTRIWTNTNVKIMTTIGNSNSNRFWEGNLPTDFVRNAYVADDNKRNEFVRNKYVEKRYCNFHSLSGDEKKLSEELCDVIRNNDRTLIEAMQLLFSGANLMYETLEAGVPTSVLQLARDRKRFLLSDFFLNNQNVITGSNRPSNPPAASTADRHST